MPLTAIKQSFSTDLNEVDKLIISSLYSEVPLVQDIGKYIVKGGGKRLRPLLVLISAEACRYVGKHPGNNGCSYRVYPYSYPFTR